MEAIALANGSTRAAKKPSFGKRFVSRHQVDQHVLIYGPGLLHLPFVRQFAAFNEDMDMATYIP